MKSNNEDYLDSLLSSVTNKKNNEESGQSRVAEANQQRFEGEFNDDTDEDAREIGRLLQMADANELIDDSLKARSEIFTPEEAEQVGLSEGTAAVKVRDAENQEVEDTRDEEERALDEALAEAEKELNVQQAQAAALENVDLGKPAQETPVAPVLSDDPNAKMSPDDIAALFAAMAPTEETAAPVEEAPVIEEQAPIVEEQAPVVEEPIVEEPAPAPVLSDDPNAKMSPDDIAALFAAMAPAEETAAPVEEAPVVEEQAPIVEEQAPVVEEPVVEEPVPEAPAAPVLSDDPNAKMSPDDIAALFAAMAPAEETAVPVEEPVVEEEAPVVEEPVAEEPTPETPAAPVLSDDPNAKMSPVDIAALFAAMAPAEETAAPVEDAAPIVEEVAPVAEESAPPVEEPVVEEPAPVVEEPTVPDASTQNSEANLDDLFSQMEEDHLITTENGANEEGQIPEVSEQNSEESANGVSGDFESPSVEDLLNNISELDINVGEQETDALTEENNEGTLTEEAPAEMPVEDVQEEPLQSPEDILNQLDAEPESAVTEENAPSVDELLAGLSEHDAGVAEPEMALDEEEPAAAFDNEAGFDEETVTNVEANAETFPEEANGAPSAGTADLDDIDAIMGSLADDNLDALNEKAESAEAEPAENGSGQDAEASASFAENEEPLSHEQIEEALEQSDVDMGLTEEGINPDDLLDGLSEDRFDEEEEQTPEEKLSEHIDRASMEDDEEDAAEMEAAKKQSKKKKKKDKKKPEKSGDGEGNFFQKLIKSLFGPDEEDEFDERGELASLSDENEQILNELDGEERPKGALPKKKKEKKEKEKDKKKDKPKKEKPKKEKPKKEKKPKPKKEKKPKAVAASGKPLKRIPPKKIAISFIFAITFGVLLLLPTLILPQRIATQEAEEAYQSGDYLLAYKDLYGQENLDAPHQQIFDKSKAISRMGHFYNSYLLYLDMDMKVDALNSLMKGLTQYDNILLHAQDTQDLQVENEVNRIFSNIVQALQDTFGLSVEDAEEVLAIPDDTDYTIRLMEIVKEIEGE